MTNVNEADKRYVGKIILINKRGYGFISCKDVPFTRIYFHWTNLLPQTANFAELKRGDEVEFSLVHKEDGTYKAIKIDVFEAKSDSLKEEFRPSDANIDKNDKNGTV